jgi:hypothetical protein
MTEGPTSNLIEVQIAWKARSEGKALSKQEKMAGMFLVGRPFALHQYTPMA